MPEIERRRVRARVDGAAHEAAAVPRGKDVAGKPLPPESVDVRAIRERLGLTRPAFAQRFGLAVSAVRDWEQGLRRPDPAARVLLKVIEYNPQTVAEVVGSVQAAQRSQPPGRSAKTLNIAG